MDFAKHQLRTSYLNFLFLFACGYDIPIMIWFIDYNNNKRGARFPVLISNRLYNILLYYVCVLYMLPTLWRAYTFARENCFSSRRRIMHIIYNWHYDIRERFVIRDHAIGDFRSDRQPRVPTAADVDRLRVVRYTCCA